MKKILILFTIIFIFINNRLYGASCCGGGSSSSLILIGDNSQEYSLGLSFRNDLGQTDNDGWASFHTENIQDTQKIFNFQFQRQVSERFQSAFKTGLIQKDMTKQNRHEIKNGLADIELQGTYEFLPEYTYTLLKPRGFIYTKVSIPMSKSLYNSNSPIFSDVSGSGLYSFSIGSYFVKHFSDFTLKTSFEGQYYFGKYFGQTKLHDYQKYLIPLGISYGFNRIPISVGTGATWSYQQAKKFSGAIQSASQSEYYWEFNLFLNWIVSREKTVGLSYSDSTIIGKNINSPLFRTFSLVFTNASPF